MGGGARLHSARRAMLAAAVLLLGAPAVGCFAPYPRVPVLRVRSAPAVTRPGARTPFAAQSREVSVALPATAGDGGEQFDIDAFDAEVQRRCLCAGRRGAGAWLHARASSARVCVMMIVLFVVLSTIKHRIPLV